MPTVTNLQGGNGMRIKFREMITGQLGTTVSSFNLTNTYFINPGLPKTFRWLSTLAQNFDQYVVHSMNVEYVNMAAATTRGMVFMVYDYDVTDAAPMLDSDMMNQYGACSGPVWAPLKMQLDPKSAMSLGPRRFIRTQSGDRAVATCDIAKLHVGFETDAISVPLGQLWIEYDITLFVPQVRPTASLQSIDRKSVV